MRTRTTIPTPAHQFEFVVDSSRPATAHATQAAEETTTAAQANETGPSNARSSRPRKLSPKAQQVQEQVTTGRSYKAKPNTSRIREAWNTQPKPTIITTAQSEVHRDCRGQPEQETQPRKRKQRSSDSIVPVDNVEAQPDARWKLLASTQPKASSQSYPLKTPRATSRPVPAPIKLASTANQRVWQYSNDPWVNGRDTDDHAGTWIHSSALYSFGSTARNPS